jgi:hypothetical protein
MCLLHARNVDHQNGTEVNTGSVVPSFEILRAIHFRFSMSVRPTSLSSCEAMSRLAPGLPFPP